MELVPILLLIAGLLGAALIGQRIRGTFLTGPMLVTGYGLVMGAAGLGWLAIDLSSTVARLLAEATLILVLFSDAAEIDLRQLRRHHDLPLRLLGIGLPLSILMGALLALLAFDVLSVWEALLLATMLAATDAALGQAVVTDPAVPLRIRLCLNVESGLNDGIALPLVLLFLSCASAAVAAESAGWLSFAATQLTLGPLAGVVVGFGGAKLVAASMRAGWMTESAEGIVGLGLAFGAYAGAEAWHGNGFIAAFVAGLTFANVSQHRCKFLLEFAQTEGRMLTHTAFMLVGAVMAPVALQNFDWTYVLFAVLALTVMRMLPVALALLGSGVSPVTTTFLGWFGPRGLASALFVLLILEEGDIPHRNVVYTAVLVTILLSILLHGLTAGPAARWYGAYTTAKGECAENLPVPPRPFDNELARREGEST